MGASTPIPPDLQQSLGDRYRIERQLGEGGMAVVYLATDLRQGRSVALKVLRPELASLIGPARFVREISIAGKLTHPHIVPLYDAGDAAGLPYYVMPFIEGESLRDRLRREHQLPVADALQIAHEVADALSYAHGQGIIHRDVKPENIMLSQGHAQVADFGIARAVSVAGSAEKLTETGMAIGTADYMSPEQATGSAEVDTRSDLYSLACVVYEMLAGAPPFAAATAQRVMAGHLVDPVPSIRRVRSTVSEAIEAAIMTALAKAKADRFATVTEFVEALEGRRFSPAHPYPAAVNPRGARRRPLVVAVAATTVIVLIAAYLLLRPPVLDQKKVLVGPVENRSGDSSLAGLAAEATSRVVSGLASTGLVQVIDARSLVSASAGSLDLPKLRNLGRRLGAGTVVTVTYLRRADSLAFEIHLTSTATGEPLRPVRPVTGALDRTAALVADLEQRIMAAYAAQFDPALANHPYFSQPASYDAYRAWRDGVARRWKANGDNLVDDATVAEAVALFRRAIALDSAFMAPRSWIAIMYWLDGHCDRADSVATDFRREGRVLLAGDQAELDHAVGWCHHDNRAIYDAAGVSLRAAPDVFANVEGRALAALLVHHPEEARRLLVDLLRSTTFTPIQRARAMPWLIDAEHELGEYQAALETVAETRRQDPENGLNDRNEMRQRAALGQIDRVNALIDRRVLKSSALRWAGDDMYYVGLELIGHGYAGPGRALCDRGVVWYQSRSASDLAILEHRTTLAHLLYCAGRWTEARSAFERLAAGDSANIETRSRLGALAVRRGDSSDVAKWDAWLARHEDHAEAVSGRAKIAALRGDKERALALFLQSWERWAPNFKAGHVEPDLEPIRDYPPFRTLLYPKR